MALRIVALRIFHLVGHSGGVVPAHVVPHGHLNGDRDPSLRARLRPLHRGMEGEAVPEAEPCQNGKGREQQHKQHHRAVAHRRRAEQIPCRADHDHQQRPSEAPPAGGERGVELAQIAHEESRVDGHVEDAGRQRKPALLKAPERPHRAPHPDVEAAIGGNRAGQLAHHQRGRQAPDKRQHEKNENRDAVARAAQDVFNAVGPARDHEVGGGDQRKKQHLAPQPSCEKIAHRGERRGPV